MRRLAVLLVLAIVPAARADDDAAQRIQRLQTAQEVARNLTPDEKRWLASAVLCDARSELQKHRDEEAIVQNQQKRMARARRLLGTVKPMACNASAVQAALRCMRAKVGITRTADPDCALPEFWKYQAALMELDAPLDDLFDHRRRP